MSAEKGKVVIDPRLCKGCGLCIEACIHKVLEWSANLNASGYHTARYKGGGCTACGLCFYACPEPSAITVYKAVPAERSAPCLAN